MVRAALSSKRRIGQGPRLGAAYVPAASVVAASLLNTLPIVSDSGWFPDFGFLALIAWRLLRSEPWPAWWAAPMGFVNDLATGAPIGLSVTIWSVTMLVIALVERRTLFRDYWMEWGLAAMLLFISEWAEWQVAAAMGAPLAFVVIAPPLLIAIFAFPVAVAAVARIDRWRLGS